MSQPTAPCPLLPKSSLPTNVRLVDDSTTSTTIPFRQLHKFGGSSLADHHCYRKVALNLADASQSGDLVVVSAAGKTTNRLIECVDAAALSLDAVHRRLSELSAYQHALIVHLLQGVESHELLERLGADLARIRTRLESGPITAGDKALIIGHGEVWSARLLAALLRQWNMPSVFVDARDVVRAEPGGQPLIDKSLSRPLIQAMLSKHADKRIVITGFMARSRTGETVLLGRNGSDYSATMIGALADVDRVTIWSDVAGIYTADPHTVPTATLLSTIHLDEANELARLGAGVLHQRALQPAMEGEMQMQLRNTFEPQSASTCIVRPSEPQTGSARTVTSVQGISVIEVAVPDRFEFAQAASLVQQTLKNLAVDSVAMAADSRLRHIQVACTEVSAKEFWHWIQMVGWQHGSTCRRGFAAVALVGRHVAQTPRCASAFSNSIASIPTKFTSRNELSIVAIVRRGDADALVARIHQAVHPVVAGIRS